MRDPKRIDKIIGRLRLLWNQHPDWRFGQLAMNMNRRMSNGLHTPDFFYIEDDDTLRVINKMIEELQDE
jgi:hypothetical protein